MYAKRTRKGISSLVAVIMLIAFTLIVAGILAGWTQQFTSTQQQQIEFCLDSSVFLYSGNYDPTTEDIELTVYNNGKVPLSFVTLLSFEDTIVPDRTTADKEIAPGTVEVLKILGTTYSSAGGYAALTSITIQSEKCPGAQDFLLKVALKKK